MDTNQTNVTRAYEKPVTKKHETMNTVQGSWLYYTEYSESSYEYTYYQITLYKPGLYYYH